MKRLFTLLIVLVGLSLQAQIPISEARTTTLGEVVTVQGIVLNGNSIGSGRFIQDATGGISSYGGGVSDLNPGDYVALTGEVSEFNGLLQISPVNELELISSDNALPSAEVTNTTGINEDNESTLVSVSGVTFTDAGGMFASNGTYEISDANGTSVIFVRSNHPFVGTEIPAGEVDMAGVVGQYNDHQLLPRDFDDVSWESTTQPPVETITIAAARSMDLGSQVSVQGIVTSGETLGSGRFVQDATGGISSFGGDVSNFNIGDEVVITGELSEYNGLLQVSPVSSSEVLSTGNDLPAPKLITVTEINEANEGMLTTIEDVTFADAGGTFESANYEISDATGVSTIYLRFSNPLVGTAIPTEETNITGIIGQFNDHQLLPRDVADLEGGTTTNPPTGDEISIGEARTTALGETVTIKGIVTNGDELGIIRYVQDETGGIACYPGTGSVDGFPDVMPGDEVLLTGVLKDYNGLLEIDPIESYEVVSSNNELPASQIIDINGMNDVNEGSIVTIEGVIFDEGGNAFSGGSTYSFSNADGNGIIYIRASNPLSGEPIPLAQVSITGIVSEFNGFQLLPRGPQDVEITSSLFITENVSLRGGIENNSLTFTWTTNASASTTAMYGLTPELELGVVGGTGSNDETSHSVTLTDLDSATCYYIQAVSEDGGNSAISNVILASTASNSSGDIDVYFNQSVEPSVADANNDATYYSPASIQNLIIDYINKAQQTIDMCVYNNNRDAIVFALNDAVNRGVQVRYVHALSTANTALDNTINFPTSGQNADNLMHNKFMVIDAESVDKSVVMTGSMNLTDNNISNDPNNLLFIQDQALARVYTKEFEEFWGGSTPEPSIFTSASGSAKKANTPQLFNIGGTEVELYFSPTDNTTSNIINAINTADDNLNFAILSFTRNDIGTAIGNAHNDGINVRGIMESINDQGSEFDYLANTVGVNLIADTPSSQLHHKYCIIDEGSSDAQVVTGSHNWSNGAENFNDENTLIIHSQAIANIYLQEFEQRWCLANDGNNCATDDGGEIFTPDPTINVDELDVNISVYPNPVATTLNIESDVVFNSYTVYDVKGSVIFGGTINGTDAAINVSYLNTGTYFVLLANNDGKKVVSFVVE